MFIKRLWNTVQQLRAMLGPPSGLHPSWKSIVRVDVVPESEFKARHDRPFLSPVATITQVNSSAGHYMTAHAVPAEEIEMWYFDKLCASWRKVKSPLVQCKRYWKTVCFGFAPMQLHVPKKNVGSLQRRMLEKQTRCARFAIFMLASCWNPGCWSLTRCWATQGVLSPGRRYCIDTSDVFLIHNHTAITKQLCNHHWCLFPLCTFGLGLITRPSRRFLL